MSRRPDVEAAASRDELNNAFASDAETEALLPTSRVDVRDSYPSPTKSSHPHFMGKACSEAKFGVYHVAAAFVLGAVACVMAQYAICGPDCFMGSRGRSAASYSENEVPAVAPPWAGSTTVHHFPPAKPTNAYPSLFPSNVGYAGGTPTGAEPAVIATAPAYPMHTGQCSHQLLRPASLEPEAASKDKHKKKDFNLFRSWGNLSPWYSVKRGQFGVESSAETPDTCVVTGLHFLHRHGARYPTAWGEFKPVSTTDWTNKDVLASYGGPANFGTKLHKSPESWNASGPLDFLNEW